MGFFEKKRLSEEFELAQHLTDQMNQIIMNEIRGTTDREEAEMLFRAASMALTQATVSLGISTLLSFGSTDVPEGAAQYAAAMSKAITSGLALAAEKPEVGAINKLRTNLMGKLADGETPTEEEVHKAFEEAVAEAGGELDEVRFIGKNDDEDHTLRSLRDREARDEGVRERRPRRKRPFRPFRSPSAPVDVELVVPDDADDDETKAPRGGV